MKNAYPILLIPEDEGYTVYIPDFQINTQGESLAEAIEMARDAIGLMRIDMEDDGEPIPNATDFNKVSSAHGELVTLVDVDFTEYRRQNEPRTVKKNCTLPAWLCFEAEKANINFSQTLQNALKAELRLSER